MPSGQHSSITTKVMGLIFALFNVTLSQGVPFCQLQQLQHLHHEKAYLCSTLCFIYFFTATKVTICGMHIMASVWDLGECSASRGTSFVIFCLECVVQRTGSGMKHYNTPWSSDTPIIKSITGACTSTIEHSVFSIMARLIVEMLFILFSIYNTV